MKENYTTTKFPWKVKLDENFFEEEQAAVENKTFFSSKKSNK
jgi:hypothetical protein